MFFSVFVDFYPFCFFFVVVIVVCVLGEEVIFLNYLKMFTLLLVFWLWLFGGASPR